MATKKRATHEPDVPPARLVAENRKALHRFDILDEVEAGIVLVGTEVKTLRSGKCSIAEAYGRIDGDEAFLVGAHIDEYTHGNRMNHTPTRKRKLLLRRRVIKRLKEKVTQQGLTLVPLAIYFSARGHAKLRLALCRGKRVGDKRETQKSREAEREIGRYV